MSIKKFFATKDNTITNAFLPGLRRRATSSNMGASDILEAFSIYAQQSSASLERARILVQYPTDKLLTSRNQNEIPLSGSVNFYLRLFNAEHSFTTPENFTMSVSPLLEEWNEGLGLDMETYSDTDASNWLSSSFGNAWQNTGSTDSQEVSLNLATSSPPHVYTQYFPTGLEDLDLDISEMVELWLQHENGGSAAATSTLTLNSAPSNDDKVKIFSPSGKYHEIHFHTGSEVRGDTVFVQISAGDPAATRNTLVTQLNKTSLFSAAALSTSGVTINQKEKGYYGNTKVSVSDGAPITKTDFSGGTGIINRGMLIKMSGSSESGATKSSYYTKKFFARGSQYFFKKPTIECRSEKIITDDRAEIYKSSSIVPASENLGKVYLYNYASNGSYVDLPSTGSSLMVSFHPQTGSASVAVVGPKATSDGMYVTSSREDTGAYGVEFAYSGAHSKLYDVWHKYVPYDTAQGTFTYTGTVADLNDGVKFTIIDTAGASHIYTFDTSANTHTVAGANSSIGVLAAKAGSDINAISAQVNASINASNFFTSTVSGSVVTIKQKTSGIDGNRVSTQDAGNPGFSVTNLAIPTSGIFTTLVTGSGFSVNQRPSYSSRNIPEYSFNITNLKSSYTNKEKVTFRVHTKNKTQALTVYTKATEKSKVSKIKEAFYKITRVSDNFEVVPYTTGSAPRYSKLSYDMSGSFFDLDMSILEPNYLYEIGFLSKFGNDYIEQESKFKFRLEK